MPSVLVIYLSSSIFISFLLIVNPFSYLTSFNLVTELVFFQVKFFIKFKQTSFVSNKNPFHIFSNLAHNLSVGLYLE